MKTSKVKLGLMVAVIAPFLMGCPKPKPPVAPEPDTEFESSIDASFANHVVTDIDMTCAFLAENDLTPDFYMPAPGTATVDIDRNPGTHQMSIAYNTTKCMDGTVRDGSIFMYFNVNSVPNQDYYRDYGFKASFVFQSYKVNGWLIKIPDGESFAISNTIQAPGYDPSVTPLTWTIEGSLQFIHPTDPSRNMTWKGKLTKTLSNSTDPAVFNPSHQEMIHWSKGVVEYRGNITGVTAGDVPYTLEINNVHPLLRDFQCYPDQVSGVTSVQPINTWKEEYHPVKSGIVSFVTDSKYPRQIYYGNEGNPELPSQCDNSGEVLIKGISYRIDFKR